MCLKYNEQDGEGQTMSLDCSRVHVQGALQIALRNLDFTLSEIKCLWRDLNRGVPGSDLGFSLKSLLILC